MDLRAVLDLLVRVDAHARVDHRLVAERDVVADRDALVHARVQAHVAAAAQDRALHDGAAADVRRRVDHRARDTRALAQRHTGVQDAVRADRGVGRDGRVVADERRPLDALDVVDLDALADPDVAAHLQARDLQLHLLVERVEVRLPVLVEVPDVLPVAVADEAVGEIVGRIERKGSTIVALELRTLDETTAKQHYAEHDGKPFFDDLVAFITRSPLVAMVVEGPDAWKVMRTMMGTTNPREAAPGTIRGDLAIELTENLVHGSDGPESAAREIALFFPGLS